MTGDRRPKIGRAAKRRLRGAPPSRRLRRPALAGCLGVRVQLWVLVDTLAALVRRLCAPPLLRRGACPARRLPPKGAKRYALFGRGCSCSLSFRALSLAPSTFCRAGARCPARSAMARVLAPVKKAPEKGLRRPPGVPLAAVLPALGCAAPPSPSPGCACCSRLCFRRSALRRRRGARPARARGRRGGQQGAGGRLRPAAPRVPLYSKRAGAVPSAPVVCARLGWVRFRASAGALAGAWSRAWCLSPRPFSSRPPPRGFRGAGEG